MSPDADSRPSAADALLNPLFKSRKQLLVPNLYSAITKSPKRDKSL